MEPGTSDLYTLKTTPQEEQCSLMRQKYPYKRYHKLLTPNWCWHFNSALILRDESLSAWNYIIFFSAEKLLSLVSSPHSGMGSFFHKRVLWPWIIDKFFVVGKSSFLHLLIPLIFISIIACIIHIPQRMYFWKNRFISIICFSLSNLKMHRQVNNTSNRKLSLVEAITNFIFSNIWKI